MTANRIQLSRRKGWRLPEGAVTVARPTMWGNPWKVGSPGGFWLREWPVHGSRIGVDLDAGDAVDIYRRLLTGGPDPSANLLPVTLNADGRKYIRDLLRAHAARIVAHIHDLRGRDLACWCKPGCPCHGDILLDLATQEVPR